MVDGSSLHIENDQLNHSTTFSKTYYHHYLGIEIISYILCSTDSSFPSYYNSIMMLRLADFMV